MNDTTTTGVDFTTCTSNFVSLSTPKLGARDPDYDWVPPLKDQPPAKRGSQCGECGMKFEYGKTYGFHCGNQRCPTGHGGF